jgi:DnaJ domain
MDYKKNYYQILEIPVTASREVVRAAYRKLAKLYHPDKNTGNTNAEENFKLINEANEILSNDILKHEYDAYRMEEDEWQKKLALKEKQDEVKAYNKKTYTKTETIVTETRIYLRGEIIVKYWANCVDRIAVNFSSALDYKINPTEVVINISEKSIYPIEGIPLDYLEAFKESDIFTMPIPQPIRCEVNGTSGTENFRLVLKEIRIKDIQLKGVTKHEVDSYGTLIGQFYGYSPKLTYTDVHEEVTECFGGTGKVERKEEAGVSFFRKEFYHPDCSTYWTTWIKIPKSPQFTQHGDRVRKRPRPLVSVPFGNELGCSTIALMVGLLILLLVAPKFFIFCLVLFAIGLVFNYGGVIVSSLSTIFSFLLIGLLLVFIVTAIRSLTATGSAYIKKQASGSTVKTVRTVRQEINSDSALVASDTLINHFLKWKDYGGRQYETNIAVSVAAVRSAKSQHNQMTNNFYRDISEVYQSMINIDSNRLQNLYNSFDSIRVVNKLDEIEFSQMLVSAIQTQPYYLVLDKSCTAFYNDDFTTNYLANCKTECCIGNELFGVRSPVEFLSDLKGDCDTRSLLLYQLFKHYNYNVALLTSNHYKHAMIGIHFTQPVQSPGLSIAIGNENFYMWETTSPNLNFGEISSNFNNLSYWNTSLLHKKK